MKAPPFQLTQYPGFIRKIMQSLDRKLSLVGTTLGKNLRRFMQNFCDLEKSHVLSVSLTVSRSGVQMAVGLKQDIFSTKFPLAVLQHTPCISDLLMVCNGIRVDEEVEACARKRAGLASEASQLVRAHEGICTALNLTAAEVAAATGKTVSDIEALVSPIEARHYVGDKEDKEDEAHQLD